MKTVVAQPGQSLYDLIIQGCGSMEAGWQFCIDNGLGFSDRPVIGNSYVVSAAALALGNAGVLQYLGQNGILIGTDGSGSLPPVVFESEPGEGVFVSEPGAVFVPE
jgi:hypothetical protein